MRLFERLSKNINYDNIYTLRKAMSILWYEFKLAVKNKNKNYAKEILDTTMKIYDELYKASGDSSDLKKVNSFIGYLGHNIKNWN